MLPTLIEVKSYLDVKGTDKDDYINGLINSCYKMFCSYVGYEILSHNKTEYVDSDGTNVLALRVNNINSIAELSIYNNLISSSEYVIEDNKIVLINGLSFPFDSRVVKVTYNSGYSTIPDDMKQLLIEFISYKFKNKENIHVLQTGDSSKKTVFDRSAIPDRIKDLLFFYRRVPC